MQENKESKIQELINKLCPDGVEFKKIEEFTSFEQPSKYIVKNTKYNDNSQIPVLTAGKTFILGYTDEEKGIYYASKDNPVIIFDDFTGAFKWVDFPFKVKSSAMKIITTNGNKSLIRFLYYMMGVLNITSKAHKRLWISMYSQIKVPLPPIEVQREIVQILDNFTLYSTDLKEGLDKELKLRKKQYEYYFEKIMKNSDYPKIQIGKIGQVKMCKRILKNQTNTKDGIPFYKIGTFGKKADAYISNELYDAYKEKYNHPKKGDILISCSGTIGRTVVYDGKPAYFQDSNIVWLEHDESIVLNRYLRFCYFLNAWDIPTGGTILRLYNDNILKTEIPVPSLEEQKRIVDILEKFESLTNDLSIGLPAEIEARQKQYEYYRDKLLNFKEMKKN